MNFSVIVLTFSAWTVLSGFYPEKVKTPDVFIVYPTAIAAFYIDYIRAANPGSK